MKLFELDEKDCDHKYAVTLDWDCKCPGCGKAFGPLKVVQKPSWGLITI